MRENIDFTEAPRCAVGKSTVCDGQGLFAMSVFEPGDIVADYSETSKAWEKTPFDKITGIAKETCWWIGESTENALVAKPESLFMRANHSRNPNTLWDVNSRKLIALKRISPAEEIFYDYRREVAPAYMKQAPPPWA